MLISAQKRGAQGFIELIVDLLVAVCVHASIGWILRVQVQRYISSINGSPGVAFRLLLETELFFRAGWQPGRALSKTG